MHAWPAPHVPSLPGPGLAPRLHDTATGRVRSVTPGPTATLYVCGITPYDATHLGHAFTYVTFDLLQRAWLDAGHDVHYAQNVTDVDDPLLERAVRDGLDWAELAHRETTLFREDMTALGVLPPRDYVGAVEAIPRIAESIARLRSRGAAYELDGDVYYWVGSDPLFGTVANLSTAQMLALAAERGGDPDRPGKKDPLDPLLWQAARPGEPSWDPPPDTGLVAGRPGWHIECATIALDRLGMPFDVQGGGCDLAFPHHEMSASHGRCLRGDRPFAHHYVHAGMVGLAGEKMSKSRGNLVFVSVLRRAGIDPLMIRLALLAHHYRTDWDWTHGDLDTAVARLARWRDAFSRPDGPSADGVIRQLRERLADDLDAPGALAAVDLWARRQLAEGGADEGAPGVVSRAVDALLGVRL